MSEEKHLTEAELTELYLIVEQMLVPYIKTCDVSNYQIAQLVSAQKKIGTIHHTYLRKIFIDSKEKNNGND